MSNHRPPADRWSRLALALAVLALAPCGLPRYGVDAQGVLAATAGAGAIAGLLFLDRLLERLLDRLQQAANAVRRRLSGWRRRPPCAEATAPASPVRPHAGSTSTRR